MIEKFRVNLEKLTFDFIVSIPNIKLTAKYKLRVKVAGEKMRKKNSIKMI